MRQLFNCKACKHTEAHEYVCLRVEMYGPGRMYERRIMGRINKYGREVTVSRDFVLCPHCGREMSAKLIKGIKTDHECDARCMASKGPNCECSCGGANHGKSWVA